MARHRQKLDKHRQSDEVADRLRSEPAGILRERLLAVSLGLKGELSLNEIAKQMGRSRATIQTWFDKYRDKGIDGLRPSKAPRGFPSQLHEQAHKELQKKLVKGSFRRVEDARVWLNKRFGINLSCSRVGALLGKLGARLKVVRPRNPQSCDLSREAFKNQLARKLYLALKSKDKALPLRIWIADEARFGLQPCLKRAWVMKGVRAHKDSQIRYDWSYIWAALEVDGKGSEFIYTEGADTEYSFSFLEQISRSDPCSEHLVIWDGASFHPKDNNPRLPSNVTVLQQPAYSPELNAVEKLWDQLRDGLCNRSWKNLSHLLDHATRWLKEFWENPNRQESLIGEGWLLSQANV